MEWEREGLHLSLAWIKKPWLPGHKRGEDGSFLLFHCGISGRPADRVLSMGRLCAMSLVSWN